MGNYDNLEDYSGLLQNTMNAMESLSASIEPRSPVSKHSSHSNSPGPSPGGGRLGVGRDGLNWSSSGDTSSEASFSQATDMVS